MFGGRSRDHRRNIAGYKNAKCCRCESPFAALLGVRRCFEGLTDSYRPRQRRCLARLLCDFGSLRIDRFRPRPAGSVVECWDWARRCGRSGRVPPSPKKLSPEDTSMRFPSRFQVCLLSLVVLAGAIYSQRAYAQDSAAAHALPKRLVGDYGYWSRTQTPPYSSAQIPFEKLTHINHDGVSFNADGSLSVPDGFLEPELITKAHAKGVKVLLLIGGDFSGVETSGTLLTLIEKLTAFAAKHNYDGFDIDWEYPASTQDRDFLVELMAGLRATNSDYVLSIDAAPWGGYGYDLDQLKHSIDYFNIMMYDCAGPR